MTPAPDCLVGASKYTQQRVGTIFISAGSTLQDMWSICNHQVCTSLNQAEGSPSTFVKERETFSKGYSHAEKQDIRELGSTTYIGVVLKDGRPVGLLMRLRVAFRVCQHGQVSQDGRSLLEQLQAAQHDCPEGMVHSAALNSRQALVCCM